MTRIAHLSDLHFGTQTNEIYDGLVAALNSISPDLIVISGDFTQNAYHDEFEQARNFLAQLNHPLLCVPGNHDIIGRNLWERFFNPYKRYKHYISENLCPVYETDSLVVMGLNSARRMVPHWNWANGILSSQQRQMMEQALKGKGHKWLITTFHHPVHKADQLPIDVVVFGGHKMMKCLHGLTVDLVLTGHVHHAALDSFGDEAHKTVYLSASTALSERRRSQANGFNLITLYPDEMQIDMYVYKDGGFKTSEHYTQKRY